MAKRPSSPGKSELRILCLGSHSDDIEIGCGGTILQLLSQGRGIDVNWVVFSGRGQRKNEAVQSAKKFLKRADNNSIRVCSFSDGYFPFEGAKIKDYIETYKDCSPDLVFTHYGADAHQDHRLISELTWNTFRNHLILEYEIPKYDGDLGRPNFFMPLREEHCRGKVDLIWTSFATQRSKRWFERDTFMSLMRLRGMECNAASGHAEAFYCRKVVATGALQKLMRFS
jgi:LmbE family N-acetylglucosaminyl deacetylase